jgi:hypothetical protein
MAKYIDVDRLFQEFENAEWYDNKDRDLAEDILICTPAADVVEVVRCKDCRYAYINSFSALSGTAVCNIMAEKSKGEYYIVQQDSFCSYGKKKESV